MHRAVERARSSVSPDVQQAHLAVNGAELIAAFLPDRLGSSSACTPLQLKNTPEECLVHA